ncbi:DUF4180 domain-containing protein [Actinocrispum sp. NPDC049592]|uniref:DUF4180 domain-containing protein n=1 Tax=Actinocrispum sp. NPDC049592 TaxID=3154835 RepID=UPI00343BB117
MLQYINGVPVYLAPASGPAIRTEQDAVELMVNSDREAEWLVIPVSRFHPDFFELRTRVAGGIVQKFVNYRVGFAMIGDVSGYVAASEPFAAFVRESNRGRHIWFVSDVDDLERRLARIAT